MAYVDDRSYNRRSRQHFSTPPTTGLAAIPVVLAGKEGEFISCLFNFIKSVIFVAVV